MPESLEPQLKPELTARQFALFLGAMVIATFPDIVFGSASFVFRDYALFGYPLAHYHRECFWRGEIPLWNPLNNCGIPYLAQWNTMVLYPLSLLYLLLPLPWSLGIFSLFHLFLGGMGMFFLARHWTGHPIAGAAAGVAFAFNGLSLSCLIWPNNIAALGCMPWVIYLVELCWRKGGRAVLLAAAGGAIQMLAGAPEIFLFTWLVIVALWVGEMARPADSRLRVTLRTGLVILLLLGLVAIQLLPFLDLLWQSNRDSNYGGVGWSMPAWGWANFLLPLFRSEPTSAGVYLQSGQAWASSYYLGIFIFALALAASWLVRKPKVWALAAFLGFSLVLALGESGHLYEFLHRIFPPLGFVRFPIKWVVPAAFIVPLLAAVSIGHFLSGDRQRKSVILNRMSVLCVFLGSISILFLLWFEHAFPNQSDSDWSALLKNGLSRMAFLALLFLTLNLFIRQPRWILSCLLLLGIWLDAATHAPRQNPGVNPQVYTLELPGIRDMNPRPRHGDSRAMLTLAAIDKFHNTIVSNTFDFMLGMRMGLYDNVNLLDGIPKVDGFYSLYLPHEQDVRRRFFSTTNEVRGPLADLLSVSHVTAPGSYFEWQSRPGWVPLISGGQKPEFFGPAETLDFLMSPDFDGRKVVYLPPSTRSQITAVNQTEPKILPKRISAHRLDFDVTTDQNALIVLSQTFYPNWRAQVDGQEVSVWRADHSLQALQVPVGLHHVSVFYRDRAFLLGSVISFVAVIASIVTWIFLPAIRSAVQPGYRLPQTSVYF